eukprot:1749670-Rhodomonas_salina.2
MNTAIFDSEYKKLQLKDNYNYYYDNTTNETPNPYTLHACNAGECHLLFVQILGQNCVQYCVHDDASGGYNLQPVGQDENTQDAQDNTCGGHNLILDELPDQPACHAEHNHHRIHHAYVWLQ